MNGDKSVIASHVRSSSTQLKSRTVPTMRKPSLSPLIVLFILLFTNRAASRPQPNEALPTVTSGVGGVGGIGDGQPISTGAFTTLSGVREPATPTGSYISGLTTQSPLAWVSLPGPPLSSLPIVTGNGPAPTDSVIIITGKNVRHANAPLLTPLAGNASAAPTLSFTGSTTISTTDSPRTTNTRPCNGYAELCTRRYSNVTAVGAHNSPFVRARNAASNQELEVEAQLDDGVRLLQGQMHWPEGAAPGSPAHFCHSSCALLDVGPITEWLRRVHDWVAAHPYDVVTIVLGNGNHTDPSMYVAAIEESGLVRYAYTPPRFPMRVSDWPTLGEMIVSGRRVVLWLDYKADQSRYPWLLDQFSQMWETPFNPVDRTFPCDVHRPPDLAPATTDGNQISAAKERLYLANHNLNVAVRAFGAEILVPAIPLLNETNALHGFGSLGEAARGCRARWGRAPNVLLVDYYNRGRRAPDAPEDELGSVFAVAAEMNGVEYQWGTCCGKGDYPDRKKNSAGPGRMGLGVSRLLLVVSVVALAVAW